MKVLAPKAKKVKVPKSVKPAKKVKVPKSVKPARVIQKLGKMKKPASSAFQLTRKEKFDKTMSKIRYEWECLRDYNDSFQCPPPEGWTQLLGTQLIAEMVWFTDFIIMSTVWFGQIV